MGLEKHLIPVYLLGTKKEIKDYEEGYNGRRLEKEWKKERRYENLKQDYPELSPLIDAFTPEFRFKESNLHTLPWLQLCAAALVGGLGTETDYSSIYSVAGLCLMADYGWRLLQAMINGEIEDQHGLVGTVRNVYKKLKKSKSG